ncbi:PREDICTED: zinc finger protein with KRAB and SCAN domains 2-like isoform X1 [Vollenhovia emeryi]|uniref:zinc finger protein with KRAB and SCAN domains 2-like isoform X1 n=1 Tax=Vollenhovia emeryi TaxID=411798 RepID=UPI0005F46D37|nr:PREDICTED: zinc finger protein with KRAB and SCAN domains 2-like isoform X1 [Vollenhovia emeryi]
MELHEFPVLIDETNVVTLLLTKDDMERATQDSAFLQNLVRKEQDVHNTNNIEPTDEVEDLTCENAVDKNKSDKSKTFVWPDKAVLLLIELYREREEEFSNGFKRSNKIWAEIAAEMNKVDPLYEVTAQQCTSKMSGLKRSYKNIVDMNKKSGNNRNSWAFFSVMDSLFGDKASIRPLAIATSDGPSDPNQEDLSPEISSPKSKSPPKKRKRIENVIEEFVNNIAAEKETRSEEIRRREENREKIREEKRLDRERRHNEQMNIQKSLVSILQQFLDKI